jgi:hypothetical protein
LTLALVLAVFSELRLRGFEQGPVHQGRNRNLDPFLTRTCNALGGTRHGGRITPNQAGPWPCGDDARPPEHGTPNISWIVEHAVQRRSVPMPQTARTFVTHSLQASAHLAQAQSIKANPGKDRAHDAGLVLHDLEPRHPAALTTTDIAIPKRRTGQCADRARASRMPTPAPRTLQNLGPLVFGNDALNLQQELVLRCTADRPVQEHDLGAAAAKLLDQEHLVGVASRQPVRRVHVNAFDLSASHRIAQLLQRRPLKVRAAPAVIHVTVVRLELQPISGDALLQRRDLTVDRVCARLCVT